MESTGGERRIFVRCSCSDQVAVPDNLDSSGQRKRTQRVDMPRIVVRRQEHVALASDVQTEWF